MTIKPSEIAGTEIAASSSITRKSRAQREWNVQLVMLGMVVANPKLLDMLSVEDCLDDGVGSVVQSLKLLMEDSDNSASRGVVSQWMSANCGFDVNGERVSDLVLKTVKENSLRERASKIVNDMALQAKNYQVSDSAYVGDLIERIKSLGGQL